MLKHLLSGLTIALALAATASCDKDKITNPDHPVTTQTRNHYIITTTVVNADGASGTCYFQGTDTLKGTIDNRQGMPAGFGVPPVVIGQHIFVQPDYMGNSNVGLRHFVRNAQGDIANVGTLELPAVSGATNVVLATEDRAFVSMQNTGIVREFNPKTMMKIRDYDLNSLAQEGMRVAPAAMVVRDGLLFVGLNQFGSNWMPRKKQAELAVIDLNTNKVLKKIIDTKHELSFATRPIDAHSIFVNPQDGAIYVNCIGAFGYVPGFDGGMLRIKRGETEFDSDYVINFSKAKVKGFDHNINYLGSIRLASNGKVYGMATSMGLDKNPNPYLAKVMVPVVVDLQNRTVEYLPGMQASNGHSVPVCEIKGKIYFGSSNVEDNGFYSYDLATHKFEGLSLRVQGFPAGLEYMP